MKTSSFPGRYDSLAKVSEFVVNAAKEAGLNSEEVYAVELAVDEACCNIIDHAYGGEGLGELNCTVKVDQGKLTVILSDTGKAFDPKSIPDPKLDVPLEQLKPRGVGLYLMRKLMDDINYETSPNHGNTLTMVKRSQSDN
ncbi:MAG: ATP-binding protein [Anaerolineales bacterium]|nr:MAG: ATP-binding protein [Anaerolineales bacterium]